MALDNAQLPVIGSQSPPNGRTVGNPPALDQGKTERNDTWWAEPLATFLVFTAFIIYATWRLLENNLYATTDPVAGLGVLHYLSPFYSPTFGKGIQIAGYNISPALWILPFPLLFRGTCYYYRKAYYRAFFWDPPACAVGEPFQRKHYTGEREFPWTMQNLHRYAFYFAVIILAILWWDALDAFRRTDETGTHFYLGLGSLIMLLNAVLLSLYTFSCHSWRHLVGGSIDCFSCTASTQARHGIWEKVTHFNERHSLWAWMSLFSVALTDLYIRFVAAGTFSDPRLF